MWDVVELSKYMPISLPLLFCFVCVVLFLLEISGLKTLIMKDKRKGGGRRRRRKQKNKKKERGGEEAEEGRMVTGEYRQEEEGE